MLLTYLMNTLQKDKNRTTLHYFCGSPSNNHTDCSRMLRSFIIQLIRHDPTLAIHVSLQFVRRGFSAALSQLRKVLCDLFIAVLPAQILVDGLDECDLNSHGQILSELLNFSSTSTRLAKVLISSREGGTIGEKFRRKPSLSLREESECIDKDIAVFEKARLGQLCSESSLEISTDTLARIEQTLVAKSKGERMILYMGRMGGPY